MDLYYSSPVYNGVNLAYIWTYFNAGAYVDFSFTLIVPTAGETEAQIEAAGAVAQAAYALAHSYIVTNTQKWFSDLATSSAAGLMSASDKTGLTTLLGAVVTPSYQAIISQTGTSAPTGATLINTYSGTPTMTWARTGTGVYTLTASSAVFSLTKTGVFIQPTTTPLNNISGVVTSTTVVTFTTSSLNLLALGVSNADAVFSKNMIYIQTYP